MIEEKEANQKIAKTNSYKTHERKRGRLTQDGTYLERVMERRKI